MTEQEIADWEREIQHFQMMEEQRKETVTFAGGKTYELPVKDNNNEINR